MSESSSSLSLVSLQVVLTSTRGYPKPHDLLKRILIGLPLEAVSVGSDKLMPSLMTFLLSSEVALYSICSREVAIRKSVRKPRQKNAPNSSGAGSHRVTNISLSQHCSDGHRVNSTSYSEIDCCNF